MKDASKQTVTLGIVATVITFICGFLIFRTVLHLNLVLTVVLSALVGAYFGFNAFYTTYLSEMIKHEVASQGLTSQDLARLMNANEKDYPIIRGELRLIVSRKKKVQLLKRLRERVQ